MNNVFITGYSLDLVCTSTTNDFDLALDRLEVFLDEAPSYNSIKTCSDWLKADIGGESLRDVIYESVDFNDVKFAERLRELNEITHSIRGNELSITVLSVSDVGPAYQGEFISLYTQNRLAPNVNVDIQVGDKDSLFDFNYDCLKKYPIDESSFSNRAQLIFDNISYHKDFESTLSTVKSGDFKLYSIEFARSLKSLHSAFPKLTNKGHNPPDLVTIRAESHKAGRTMGCTVQGKNKKNLCNKHFKIKMIDGSTKTVNNLNCEFHLKINYDNNGTKLEGELYNRAYFGLPLIDGKKYIALLHLGKHYD